MNENLKMVILGVVIFLALFLILSNQKVSQNLGMIGSSNVFYADSATTTEHSAEWISTTAEVLAYRNNTRQFAEFRVAENSTNSAWIWQATSTDLVTTSGGLPLTTTTPHRIDSTNLYRGEIQAVGDGDVRVFWIEQ